MPSCLVAQRHRRDLENKGQCMSRRIGHIILMGWLVVAAGCLTPRAEAPPLHTYQLTLDEWSTEHCPTDIKGPVLLVSVPQPEPGFDTTRMVYLKRQYELEYYAVNQWADVPARLFGPLLVQALGRIGMWRAVIPLPSSVHGNYRLDSYGFAVQQEFLQQPSRVRVTVRAQFVELQTATVVGVRTFEAIEPAPRDDAYGGVQAANRATIAILNQVGSWLQGCVQHPAECGR